MNISPVQHFSIVIWYRLYMYLDNAECNDTILHLAGVFNSQI